MPSKTFGPIFIDSFSGPAADLKPADRTPSKVLAALRKNPRVSTWDMSEHPWLQGCISILQKQGYIKSVPEPYPWHRWEILGDPK